jgi:hypothetical protein
METNYNALDYDKLRTNIEMLTNARGLFPVDVAALLGMSKAIYRGKRKCPWTFKIEELEKISEILDVDLVTLMYGSVYIATKNYNRKLNICF